MSPDGAEAMLFGEALACDELRPAAFVAGAADPALLQAEALRAEAFLQAIAIVEDSRGEEPDEHTPASLALHRVEAKLDLLTTLVGSLLRGPQSDPAQALRWSALGACLVVPGAVAAGSAGSLRIQPSDWLPQALLLPVRVLACDAEAGGHRLWLAFESLPPGLATALERHLFRIHRRAIAERRRPR